MSFKSVFLKKAATHIQKTNPLGFHGLHYSSLSRNLHSQRNPNFPKPNLDEIREQFRKFEGGRVTLTKNEETGLAFICIDHADKKNGISGKMMVDFNEVIASLEGWENGKGILLHGQGDSFCSGGYLDTVKQICNHTDGYKMASLMHDSVLRLRRLPFVSVAVVHGKAIGGGAEILLAPDFRLLTPSAEIAYVEARMGVGTGWGGGTLLQELVGHQKALDLLLTCRKISSTEALKMGLADGILDEEKNYLERAVDWLISKVAHHDPSVVQAVKKIVQCGDLDKEKTFFANTWGGKAQLRALNKNIKHK